MSKHVSYLKLQKAYWYINHLQKVEKKRKLKKLVFMFLPFMVIVGAYLGIQFKDLYQLNHIKLSKTITSVVTEPQQAKTEVLMTEKFIETSCEDELVVEEDETFVVLEKEDIEIFYEEAIETIETTVQVDQQFAVVEKVVASKATSIEEVPIIETNQIKSIDISAFAQATKFEHTLAIAPKVAAIKAINIHQMLEVSLEDAGEIAELEAELEEMAEAEEE